MLLGFKKQFKEPILVGTKVFTIRKRRKVRPKIGETIHMYSGLRTKHTEFISNKEKLVSTQNVRITIEKAYKYPHRQTSIQSTHLNVYPPKSMNLKHFYCVMVTVDGRAIGCDELEMFVEFDGFKNVIEWADYWLDGKDRTGALMEIYHWTDLRY